MKKVIQIVIGRTHIYLIYIYKQLTQILDIVIPSHMLEIYDFPKAVRTQDLLQVKTKHFLLDT